MTRTEPRLFDPKTREVIRRENRRTLVALLTVFTLLTGGGCGVMHHEIPVVDFIRGACDPAAAAVDCPSRLTTSYAVGIAFTVIFAVVSVVVYRHRPIRPSVTCESCGGVGWVMDLERLNGHCPHCGYDSFTYRAIIVQPPIEGGGLRRVFEPHMNGSALIRRFHETRTSPTARYY
jgi:hypothetical protein